MKMHKSLHAIALVFSFLPFAVQAQDFGAGLDAFSSGDGQAALREWGPLAAQGDPRAQFWLGRMYAIGEGVNQDYIVAVDWYRRAAAQGFAIGQRGLGQHYAYGHGVPQDYVLAHMWFDIALENGDYVREYRDFIERRMTGSDISKALKKAHICLESGYRTCE